MLFSPFEQFDIIILGGILGNNTSMMLIVLLCILLINGGDMDSKFIGCRYSVICDRMTRLVIGLVEETLVGISLSVFIMIIMLNLLGLICYGYTVTSQLIITTFLSIGVWLGKLYLGIDRHGRDILAVLIPSGVSFGMIFFFVFIELVGFITPIISLSVRLFANMLSGHVLLKVLFGFVWIMLLSGGGLEVLHSVTMVVLLFLYVLEFGVGVVQAYVFTLLSGIYIRDMKYLSH